MVEALEIFFIWGPHRSCEEYFGYQSQLGVRIRTPSATDCHTIGETNAICTTLCDNCKLCTEFAKEGSHGNDETALRNPKCFVCRS